MEKTQEELDKEQQAQEETRLEEERIAKEKEENPEDLGDDPDDEDNYKAEVEKKGAKNVILENKRKAEDNKKLKEENDKLKADVEKGKSTPAPVTTPTDILSDVMQTEKGRRYVESERAYGKSDSEIRSTLDMMDLVGETKANNAIKPMKATSASSSLTDALDEMAQNDEDKIAIEMFGKDIKAEMVKEKIKPEFWGDKTLIKSLLGSLLYTNRDKFAKQSREIVDTPLDGGKKGGSPSGGGVSNDELEKYALENDIELSNQEVRSKVKKAILMRKKAMKE